MTPERWQQIKDLFQTLLEQPPESRGALLRSLTLQDPELKAEVESLLASHANASGFIESPALASADTAPSHKLSDPWLGRRIGAYRILREIGHGGMGAVYLAERADDQYRRQVAVKVVRRDDYSDFILRRFLHERQILAGLDHPNIARLYDGGTSPEGAPFFVMEYVEGLPLNAYCDDRKLNTAGRLDLFRQICSAVHYAHARHVVHRDLKPGNILVTREGMPKLLDFGIAKILNPEASEHSADATLTSLRLMTPHYASPEQVRGEPITPASDIYSLGVLLYELLTGRRPYRVKGALPHELVQAICEQEPERPSTSISRVETLDGPNGEPVTLTPEVVSESREGRPDRLRRRLAGDLDAIILKAMRKQPEMRYESAAELSDDLLRHLRRQPVAARKGAWAYRCQRWLQRHRVAAVASAACLLVVLGASLLLFTQAGSDLAARLRGRGPHGESGLLSKGSASRRSVALLGFKNLSGRPESAWLSTALAEMLTSELAAGGQLRAIPGENVARVRMELALEEADSYSKETLVRLRSNLGSDVVVVGSFLVVPGEARQIRLDLRLQDAVAGETFGVVSETGSEEQLLALVARSGARLRQELGVADVASSERTGVTASFPANPQSARLYAEGLDRLRKFEPLAARDLLERAVHADPRHALSHSALATAWAALGYDEKARLEARQAVELSERLSREDRLSVEGLYRELSQDWSGAVEIYRTLFNFFPDSLDYGLRLAAAQTAASLGSDALATVAALRRLPEPNSHDPRIDLAESSAASALSDYERERQALLKTIRKGREQGAQLLVARARLLEGRVLRNLGRPEEASAALEEARTVFDRAGDLGGVALALNSLAAVLSDQGDPAGSVKLHEQSLAICRRIGDKRGTASALNNLAIRLKDQGRLQESMTLHEEALSIRRELGDKALVAVSLSNIGVVLYGQDDLAGAKQKYEESLAISRETGEKRAIVRALHNLALVLKDQGDLAQAAKLNQESLVLRREIGDQRGIAMVQLADANVLFDQGELQKARILVEEALSNETKAGHKRGVAYDLALLGEIFLAQGDLAQARRKHEQALELREQLGEWGTAGESRLYLANLSIEEGRPQDAERAARLATSQFRRERARSSEAQAYLVLSRALLSQRNFRAAAVAVDRAAALSARSQRTALVLSTELTAARIRAAQGYLAEALRRLHAVDREANQLGYGGIHLEAQLALAELEVGSGDQKSGRSRMAKLRERATNRGFGLIARKAAPEA
ncbi:MAG: tetratricopeptide repeat protein [Acidobacteriota bacterium]